MTWFSKRGASATKKSFIGFSAYDESPEGSGLFVQSVDAPLLWLVGRACRRSLGWRRGLGRRGGRSAQRGVHRRSGRRRRSVYRLRLLLQALLRRVLVTLHLGLFLLAVGVAVQAERSSTRLLIRGLF